MFSMDPRHTSRSAALNHRCRVALPALAAITLVALAGCGVRPPPPKAAVTTGGPEGGVPFVVDANASELWLYLHADGPLAKVGHTHVITNHDLHGTIWLHPQPEQSGCEVRIPVNSFVVDDPKERALAGGEYAEPLDEDARTGTRDHMLGDKQLNAAQYPVVALQCRQVTIGAQGSTVLVTVMLRDHSPQLTVPVKWQQQGNTLQAEGEMTFTQTSMGLEPYSLLFGALRVSDEIRVRYRFVARSS